MRVWNGARTAVTLILGVVVLAAPTTADAVTLPPGFSLQTYAQGLDAPTGVAFAPDGRTFVAEKAGIVRVVAADGTLLPDALYDLTDHVNNYGDRGLLGIAVDSSFATNHYLWLLYTYETDRSDYAGPKVSRLARVTVNDNNTLVNPAAPETVVLGTLARNAVTPACPAPSNLIDCIPSDGPAHSIGTVRSASDGTLWVGSGDAADYGGFDARAFRTYDEQSFAGKILHITRTGQGVAGHPFCPADTDLTHVCTKLYAKGFRNPYRFTLRPGGGIFAADVGWNTREEVDLVSAGNDYGWPCYEGAIHTPTYSADTRCNGAGGEYSREGTANAAVAPIADYDHADGAVAVVAGPVYDGTGYPATYSGSMFFGDYGSGELRRVVPGAGGNPVSSFGSGAYGWVSLEPAPGNGDLVAVDFSDGQNGNGSLRRITYSPVNTPPTAVAGADRTSGATPLVVAFSSADSGDPDAGDTVTYDWDFGDNSVHSGAPNPSHTYARGGYTARLTVTDSHGASATDVVRIVAGGPTAAIQAPIDNSSYRDGDTVTLHGSATDTSGAALPSGSLAWQVTLHHKTHIHALGTFPGADTSFAAKVDHDADSYYDVTLTATDANGLQDSRTVTIVPEVVSFVVASSPDGAPLTYAGADNATRTSTLSAIGFQTTVSADGQFLANGRTYRFDRWSDGATTTLHDVAIPANPSTLTAIYHDASGPPVPAPPPAVGDAATPPGDPGAPSPGAGDGSRPTDGPLELRLAARLSQALLASNPTVRGTASDSDGVQSVRIGLRLRRDARPGCRWWSSRLGRLTRARTSCDRPHWLRAWMTPGGLSAAWAVRLGGRVPDDSYVLTILGTDASGHTTHRLADGRHSVLVSLRRARRRLR